MKILHTLRHSFVITAILLFASSVLAKEAKIIHVHSWLPPAHTMNANVLPTWGKWIDEATEGRVKVKIEYPGGHPKSALDNVVDGVYQAGWTFHGYSPGRFKLTKIVELPGLGAGAGEASKAYWQVHEQYLAQANEHRGVIVAGLFTHGPGHIHLAKPISSLKEMDGKKIRVGGGVQSAIAKRMGVEGVAAPGSKVYEILSQGVADGVFMPMGEKRSLRLKEVVPFTMKFPGGMYLGSFGIFLNEDFMASLSEKDRQAILRVSGEKLSEMAGDFWQKDVEVGEADAKKFGNTILEAPASVLQEFTALTEGMDEEWYKEVKDRGINAKAALEELRKKARSY